MSTTWHAYYAHFTTAMTDVSTDDATASAVLQDIIRDHVMFHDDTDDHKPLSAIIRDYAMFSEGQDNPTDGILTPSSYKGAMSSRQKRHWLLAMDAGVTPQKQHVERRILPTPSRTQTRWYEMDF